MSYADYQTLLFARTGAVLTVTLNRPRSFNAVDGVLHRELSHVFREIAADASVDAVVLTGAGKAFSAGGDLDFFRTITPAQLDAVFVEARRIIVDLVDLPQPIISAINGAAAGLGATLALFCDVVFAADDAKISDPHVRIGVTAGDGGAVIWPLLVGPARAKQYLMTGDTVSALEAERIGLVNRVVPAAQLVGEAQAFAERLTRGARLAIRTTKASVNKTLREAVNLVLDTSLACEKECFGTSFHHEALEAFAQKRAASGGAR